MQWGAGGSLRCGVLGFPQCDGDHEPKWPAPEFRGGGPMWPTPLTSGGLALGEVTCGGWGPHPQYSFLIKLASLSVIHSVSFSRCPVSPSPYPPTFACDPYNNTPVIATGRQTETFKTTTAHASNRSTFSISLSN